MTVTVPDFTNLTAAQFFVILVVVAAIDFLTGIGAAILKTHTFDWAAVLNVLYTHGVQKVLPIAALFAAGTVSNDPSLCFAADGFLALYFVQTLQSSYQNLTTSAPAVDVAVDPTPPPASPAKLTV